jgi:SulP family sulfate permease
MPDGSATAHLFRPKLATVLAEGYGLDTLKRDFWAALTVAIVALPLSMAIGIASGVSPARGLYTAIVGGFVVSALSGSRHQIGGPAGAFIVLVAATVARVGLEGLILTVFISGVFTALLGLFRLGTLIRHIPHAVTVGFTAGIAVTIAASQLADFAGLKLTGHQPGPFGPKIVFLARSLPNFTPADLGLGIMTAALILALKRYKPTWPAMLLAVVVAAAAAALLHAPAATLGGRFGALPRGLPAPRPPPFSWALLKSVLPTAVSFTLLGAVESLLSAKVADGMTGRRHRSNMELFAQGAANMVSAVFGGISVTGTIARTATNIRAGGRTPVSGMLHALMLLSFMAVAAPLAGFIPLAALAGVLLTVCWSMIERAEILRLGKDGRQGPVLLITFGLTVFKDLTFGMVAGCLLAALVWAATKRPLPQEGA